VQNVDGSSKSTVVTPPLKAGLAAVLVAAFGAAIGFLGVYFEWRTLSLVGFFITAAGVIGGFATILWGWFCFRGDVKSRLEHL
jgi:hypothetical protein